MNTNEREGGNKSFIKVDKAYADRLFITQLTIKRDFVHSEIGA